jgi:hypothetical protein
VAYSFTSNLYHRAFSTKGLIVILTLAAFGWTHDLRAAAREVWIAVRTDGQPGSGTASDPLDGGSLEKMNALVEKFRQAYGDNLTVHFGPGVFYGDHNWQPMSNWKIRGSGIDVTIFKTKPNPNGIGTVGFRAGGYTGGPSGFELSDCTFDFNTPELRKANRAFVFLHGVRWQAGYFYAGNLPQWSPRREYRRGEAVVRDAIEYMALDQSQGKEPAPGPLWSALRPNRPAELAAWSKGQTYKLGEAVRQGDSGYVCTVASTTADPAADREHWQTLNPQAPDPSIYTCAAFVHARPPGGQHRISRVKAINGNGSWFFGREDFIFGLGGNDCVIEDCIVEHFQGDYGSLIIVSFGQHGVIRGCTVRGNDGLGTMAYGGWACWDAVFENNFCTNVSAASNIDSLNCRNVTFRNNVFLNCRDMGILVNLSGNIIADHSRYSMSIDGRPIRDFARSSMDGLFIYNNLVEVRDGAPYGAIQAQSEGLRNVLVHDNVLRTTSGCGRGRAIGILRAESATAHDNLCESGMYADVFPQAMSWRNNRDFLGQPMKDRHGRPLTGRAEESTTTRK